ncbi:hypothetical protein AFLA_000390 [Aspergillus flavus NRRL3357]|nr:hypothetical protein AFLA_000390 [Aspergillus flavus NRRL3357]
MIRIFLAKTITTDSSSMSQRLRGYNHSGGIEVLTSRSIVQLVESFTHKQKSSMPCFQQFLEAIASIYGSGTVYEETSVSGRNVVFNWLVREPDKGGRRGRMGRRGDMFHLFWEPGVPEVFFGHRRPLACGCKHTCSSTLVMMTTKVQSLLFTTLYPAHQALLVL